MKMHVEIYEQYLCWNFDFHHGASGFIMDKYQICISWIDILLISKINHFSDRSCYTNMFKIVRQER